MGITLIVNPGSSSKKFALYSDSVRILDAYVESDADGYNMCTLVKGVQQHCSPVNRHRFHESMIDFIDDAIDIGVIKDKTEIDKVAVRVVAPGTFFQVHREIDNQYLIKLKEKESVAPLHIPNLLKEINVIKDNLPHSKIIAVSDTEFHKTIPDFIRRYSLPDEEMNKYDIKRFGYHGLSVSSVIRRIHAVTGIEPKKAIVCHIGSGVSVTAVKDYKSYDTTMGFAPGDGLIMRSRAGDLDAGALLSLMQIKNLKPIDAQNYIQTHGGLFGLTGEVDLRILLERRVQGDAVAKSGIDSFIYQIQKAIGGYMAILGGLDLLVFTATASERSPVLRTLVTNELLGLGIALDSEKNELCIGRDGVISPMKPKIKVAVIKTDESDEMFRVSQTF